MNPFDSRWPPQTLTLMVRIESNEVTGKDFVDWGMEALAAGFDSPALRRLAGLSPGHTPSRFDAEPQFRVAVREIGLPEVGREEILLAFMDECAQSIVDGAANLDQILQTIHASVIDPLDHREDLMPWCYARGGFQSGSPEALDEEGIRALARKWLDGRSSMGEGR